MGRMNWVKGEWSDRWVAYCVGLGWGGVIGGRERDEVGGRMGMYMYLDV
jgi:hypothetical protein